MDFVVVFFFLVLQHSEMILIQRGIIKLFIKKMCFGLEIHLTNGVTIFYIKTKPSQIFSILFWSNISTTV